MKTPSGITQAKKYVNDICEKIEDILLKKTYKQFFKKQIFDHFEKFSSKKDVDKISEVEIPDVNIMTINVIKSIVQTYPELAEKYMDFFVSLNISFDENVQKTDLSIDDANKFIISFKLQRYLKSLQDEKLKLLSNIPENAGDEYRNKLKKIDEKILKANEKQELLLDINK